MDNTTVTILLIDNLDMFVPSGVRVLRITFVMIVSLLGVIGNCLVATVMYKVKHKNSTDLTVLAMSVIDLYCSIVLGFSFFCRSNFECWDLISSNTACRFHYVSISIGNVSSSMLLTLIAVDRYFKTCRPLTGCLTAKQSKISISVLMASCALVSLPNLSYSWNSTFNACVATPGFEGFLNISNAFAICLFLIMFATVMFAYKSIYGFLKRRNGDRDMTFVVSERTVFARNNKVAAETRVFQARNVQTVNIGSNSGAQELLNENRDVMRVVIGEKKEDVCTPEEVKVANDIHKGVAAPKLANDKPAGKHIRSIFSVPTPGSSRHEDTEATSSSQHNHNKDQSDSKLVQIRKTCRMMSLITVIFIASWLTSLCSGILWISFESIRNSVVGRSIIYLLGVLYMINCISNPFLYFKMSSVFRQRLIKLIFDK